MINEELYQKYKYMSETLSHNPEDDKKVDGLQDINKKAR
jgi:hypothetical protein